MLEAFESGTAQDFRQRYRNSYGFYPHPETKKKILVQMTEIDEYNAHFIDANENGFIAKADVGNVFEFIPVRKKLFVANNCLMYIRRRPARMWSRGVNSANTHLSNITKNVQDTKIGFETVTKAFLEEVGDVKEALRQLKADKVRAVVLSDMFGINIGALYLYNFKIGTLKDTTFTLDNNMFKQEMEDLVRDLKIDYTVVKA